MTDAFYTLDGDWRFTFANAEAEGLLRRSGAELLGRSVWDVFLEAVGTILYLEYRRAIETGKTASPTEPVAFGRPPSPTAPATELA